MSNDNGYFKKFKVIGIAVPSEKIVEVMNIIAGNDAVLLTNSVSQFWLFTFTSWKSTLVCGCYSMQDI